MKNSILTFLLIASSIQIATAQDTVIDTNAVKYYPLKIGNYWVYSYYAPPLYYYRFSKRVIDTLVTNGHKYFKVRTAYSNSWQPYIRFERVDSVQGNIRVHDTSGSCQWLSNEWSLDSLSARLRDSSIYECNAWYYRCVDDSTFSTWCGVNKRRKGYAWSNYFEESGEKAFVQDIGLVSNHNYGMYTDWTTLLGFVINGIPCGDTSLTGITPIPNEIPSSFQLYQNYPNPFNSTTKIKFDVPVKTIHELSLRIYDLLGHEIATLVNEQLRAGAYEVEWDATNHPSGAYYYKMEVGDYIKTKKLVLIK